MMTNETLLSDDVKTRLRELHEAADRHYHGMRHIEAMLVFLKRFRKKFSDPAVVEAAIWFHDAVYDSRRNDNEELSAELAYGTLAGHVDAERLSRIVALIRATVTHQVPDFPGQAERYDAALFLDMDLSILGAEAPAFDAYEAAVRREYAWVNDAAWRAGRTAVLKSFLDRPDIYHTALFARLFEAKARENISRSIAALTLTSS